MLLLKRAPQLPALLAACLLAAGAAAQPAAPPAAGPVSPPRLIYGGDAAFPPYEYLDGHGQPRGFNIEVLRLLAQETGARVEFRLAPWNDRMGAFERGQVDLMSLAYSEPRAERYDLLVQTWTLHRGFLVRGRRDRYPKSLEELVGERVACEERGQIHEAILRLPAARRPELVPVADQREACRLLQRGEVTLAAGSSLTLRYFAAELGIADAVEVDVQSFPYFLAARKGRRAELQFLIDAFERVRLSDQYHAVVERSMALPARPRSWLDHWRSFAALLGLLLALAGGSYGWNRALTAKVQRRTHELQATLREKERLTSALVESESRFRGMVEGLALGVIQHGPAGEVLFANAAAQAALGLSGAELRARGWRGVLEGALREDGQPLASGGDPVARALATAAPVRDTVLGLLASGRRVWIQAAVEPELLPGAGVRGLLTTFSDISERRRSQEQIRHLAYHDSLTGLPNRELFLDRLAMALVHAARHGTPLAVAFIDLDQFKVINDSLGHTTGDHVLQSIAQRIRACLRDEDTVARLGGDEFTAILPGVSDATQASRVAEKLQHAIKQPLPIEGRELLVSASIGIGLYPGDGEDAESLLKNADTAMYRAKELGRDQCQFYTAAMSQRVMLHLDLEERLRKALAAGELRVHYQPIVELGSGAVEGLEALVRWQDAERGMIPPDEFIPLAEMTGLVGQITAFVLRTSCAERAALPSPGARPLQVAVNLSARQFHRGEVLEQVERLLAETRLPPGLLELEITETVAMQDHARAVETLQRLRGLGVRLAIDDFGTGYSSLSYLRRLPIHTVKIDRSFVHDVGREKSATAIVGAIIAVAHELGLRVVAEGVETEQQLASLRLQGCNAAQGFLLSRPLPAAQLPEQFARLRRAWSEFDVRAQAVQLPS